MSAATTYGVYLVEIFKPANVFRGWAAVQADGDRDELSAYIRRAIYDKGRTEFPPPPWLMSVVVLDPTGFHVKPIHPERVTPEESRKIVEDYESHIQHDKPGMWPLRINGCRLPVILYPEVEGFPDPVSISIPIQRARALSHTGMPEWIEPVAQEFGFNSILFSYLVDRVAFAEPTYIDEILMAEMARQRRDEGKHLSFRDLLLMDAGQVQALAAELESVRDDPERLAHAIEHYALSPGAADMCRPRDSRMPHVG